MKNSLRKKRYQEIIQLYRTSTCFSVSSFSAHKNLREGIQNERAGV
ncbi:hypothetical protein CSC02_2476 [Enterobacter hormaechei subsp. hoffmannii]|nr:hypothetical protein CSC02_2476 [Enterobacter hormaechei subsp. hoffmannii]